MNDLALMQIARLFVLSSLLSISTVDVAQAKPANDWAWKREREDAEGRPRPAANASRVTAPKEEEQKDPRSYSLPLGLGYAVPPVLSGALIGVSAASGSAKVTAPFIYLGLASMFLVPPGVHAAHGNAPGAMRALLGTFGATLTLGYLGGIAAQGAADCSEYDDGLCEGFSFLGGAVLGGVIGYTSWAILDISLFARKPDDADPPRSSRLQLTPTFGPILNRTAASHTPTLHGISLGVMGSF
ncbi:MAG TPA: hypothetical protein VHO25_10450 [Polyangiaceae bacterium]|nr:hypothetical protein [Polyangiaceae bacterium]